MKNNDINTDSKDYNNVPPKEIMNVIWGNCFDYKDFDKVVNKETVRNRIYSTWQGLHYLIDKWITADEKGFLDYIKNNKPDLNDRK